MKTHFIVLAGCLCIASAGGCLSGRSPPRRAADVEELYASVLEEAGVHWRQLAVDENGNLFLWVEDQNVTNLEWTKGLPIKELHLIGCSRLEDISAVKCLDELQVLNLNYTAVSDLTALTNRTLETLSLTECPVTNIAPLASCRIRNLCLTGTRVRDVAPLSGMNLHILELDETQVEDLRPLLRAAIEWIVMPDGTTRKWDPAKLLELDVSQ